jgi:CDP-diacylglycerol--glycerol-3-phosphate 3-phosphatidyltransferase
MTFASLITFSRIFFIIPIIFFCSQSDLRLILFGLTMYIFASLTDFLDGYVARKTNTVSELGALYDLLADKIFVSTILIWLVYYYGEFLLFLPAVLIVCREILISSLRQYIAQQGIQGLEVDISGKLKTTFQMVSVGFLLVGHTNEKLYLIGIGLIWMSTFLSFLSLFSYIKKLFREKEKL